jgi:hypothetical protein
MKCECCDNNPAKGGKPVYRVNLKGEIGIWRCWECLTLEQRAQVHPEVKELNVIIGGSL